MKRRTQQCIAAFVITGIVILALCGFIAVDLSTDRYMPGQYEPLFRLSEISDEGMRISILGHHYRFLPELLVPVKETAWKLRGLLPNSAQATAHLIAQGYAAATDYLEANRPPEEPW